MTGSCHLDRGGGRPAGALGGWGIRELDGKQARVSSESQETQEFPGEER